MTNNNQLQVFKNEELGLQTRVIQNEDGSISINAEDTAIGFGWTQVKNSKIYVKWERMNKFISDLGFSPQVGKDDYIPESLFYLLGMKAENDVAKKFQQWLAVDVIPSIRKHGVYMTSDTIEKLLEDPDTIIKLATTLKEERQARKIAEQQLEEAKPKINFADKIEFTKASIDMKKFADLINIKGFGRNKLMEWLRNNGYLNKRNEPYRSYIEQGIFETKERVIDLGSSEKIQITTFVTGKGQIYLYNKIINNMQMVAQ